MIMSGHVTMNKSDLFKALAKELDLTQRKAEEIVERVDKGLVIGADTVVVCDGEIFGKPSDIDDARRILRQLAGKTHQVYTGVAVIRAEDRSSKKAHAVTDVTFRPLSEANIDRYFEMIDPLDKELNQAIQ